MTQNLPKKRDRALTFWLILILVGNALFLVSQLAHVWKDIYFLFLPFSAFLFLLSDSSFGIPLWGTALFIVYSAVSIGSVAALFRWRKWGFYAICLAAAAAFVTSLFVGVLSLGIIVNCASTLILGFLLITDWHLFRA